MKVYVITDTPEFGINASNLVNRAGSVSIVSEEKSDDLRDMLADLKSNVDTSYDLVLMICHNAKDVAISANKLAGVRAVVCKDNEDAVDAVSETRANVILIDSSKINKAMLASIIDGMLTPTAPGNAQQVHKATAPVPAPQRVQAPAPQQAQRPTIEKPRQSFVSGLRNKMPNVQMPARRPAVAVQAPAPRKPKGPSAAKEVKGDMEDMVKAVKQKGLLKAMKDALGIED